MGQSVIETAQVVVEAVDRGASQGFQRMEAGLSGVNMAAQAADRAMQQLRESAARSATMTGMAPGAGTGAAAAMQTSTSGAAQQARMREFMQTEAEVQRLLAMMDAIPRKLLSIRELGGLRQALLGAKDPATEVDAVAQRLDFLRTKMYLLEQASGRGWQGFRQQIMSAADPAALAKIQQAMDDVGVKAGQAAPKFQSLSASIKNMLETAAQGSPIMSGFLGGILGYFAAGGVTMLIMNAWNALKKFVEGVKELALAQRGLHVESLETGLSVNMLETLKVAAAETGVELGQLRMGMRQLSVNMEKQPEVFKALGIEVRGAHGQLRDLDEMLPDLMQVFKGITNDTERLALASGLLGGRMGARLLPMLTLGADALRAFREEGIKLGVILNDTDDAALVKLARDVSRADLAMEGINKHLKLELVPVWEMAAGAIIKVAGGIMVAHAALERLKSLLGTGGGLSGWLQMGQSPLERLAANRDKLGDVMEWMRQMMRPGEYEAPAYTGPKSPGAQARPNSELNEMERRARRALELLNQAGASTAVDSIMSKLRELSGASADAIESVSAAYDGSRAQMEAWVKQYGEETAFKMAQHALLVRALTCDYGAQASAVIGLVEKQGKLDASLKTTREQAENVREEFARLYGEATRTNLDNVVEQTQKLVAKFEGGTISVGRFRKEAEQLMSALQQSARADVADLPPWMRPDVLTDIAKETRGLAEAWVVLNNARISAGTQTNEELRNELLRGMKPVTETEPQALPEDIAAWDRSLLKFSRDVEMAERQVNHLGEFAQNVFADLGSALAKPIDNFLDHVFASKSGWAVFWRTLADDAITELERIAESAILSWVLRLFASWGTGGGGGLLDSGAGGSDILLAATTPASPGTEAALASVRNNVTTINYVIQTFAPRDVLMELVSPNGSLRKATESLALAREY